MSAEFEGMGLVDLIDLLEPVPEPPSISMWPQTSGWIILGLGLVVGLCWVCAVLLKRRAATAYRRAAIREVGLSGDDPVAIAVILRRAALVAYPRADVAKLTGTAWLRFLDDRFPGSGFVDGAGSVLATAPYRAAPQPPAPGLSTLACTWLRQHQLMRYD